VKITDHWLISTDRYNFILERLSPVKDRKTQETKMEWKVWGYYTSVPGMKAAIARDVMKEAIALSPTLEALEKNYKKAIDRISVQMIDKTVEEAKADVA